MQQQAQEIVKHSMDAGAVGSLVLVLGQYLTPIVLILTVIWTCIRIYNAYLDMKIKKRTLKDEHEDNSV